MSNRLGAILGTALPVVIAGGVGLVMAVPQARNLLLNYVQKSGAAVADAQMGEDEREGEQMNAYVYCMNNVNHRIRDSMERYGQWVDTEKGPTGEEKAVYGLYKVDATVLTMCKDGTDKADKSAVNEELKKLAKAYRVQLDKFAPQLEKAAYYYEQKKYQDDAFAEGKKMHKPLVDGYKEFLNAAKPLEEAVDRMGDERSQAALAKLEKEQGKTLPYWHRKTMIDAKKVMQAAEQEKLDVQAFGKQLDELEEDIKELKAQPASQRPMMWSMFEGRPDKFLQAARALWRRHRDKKEFTESELTLLQHGSGSHVEGTFDQVIDTYNSLVDGSNAL